MDRAGEPDRLLLQCLVTLWHAALMLILQPRCREAYDSYYEGLLTLTECSLAWQMLSHRPERKMDCLVIQNCQPAWQAMLHASR